MQGAVTATYHTRAAADLVRDELERFGIARNDITILPDSTGTLGTTATPTASDTYVATSPGYDVAAPIPSYADADFGDDFARLRALGLPEDEARGYQQAIRDGDVVVSVRVDEDGNISQIKDIMRRPEDARHGGAVYDDSGTRTVTAIFDAEADAGDAVNRLREAGVPDRCIRVIPTASEQQTHGIRHKDHWDALGDFSFPDEDRYAFAEALSRGSYLVTVHDFDSMMQETIIDILDDEGTVDLDARETEWRSAGWAGYAGSDYAREGAGMNTRGTIYDDGMQDRSVQMAADAGRRSQADLGSQQAGYAASGSMAQTTGMGRDYAPAGYRDTDLSEDGTVKVVEERLAVGKRDVDRGAVRVRSYVREEPVAADVDLRSTRVFVERRPVDRAVEPGDVTLRDQVIEAREHREEPVVAKEARVVEEIGLRQETETRTETVQDTVRKTEVEIEDERSGERTNLTGDDPTRRDRF